MSQGVKPPYVMEQAKVYRVGNRRFFSRAAAVKGHAYQRFKRKYPCNCEPEVGYFCYGHSAEGGKALGRYMRFVKFLLRRRRS